MEQSPKTSFIPKQTVGVAAKRQHRTFNILTFFAMIVFLASLTLSVGVFFYHQYSSRQLEQSKKDLADKRSEFNEGEIQSLRALEQRLNVAEALLNGHLSLSRVFTALELRMQEHAQITSFAFKQKESGSAVVDLSGVALSFNTIALQERQFSEENIFDSGSVIFSDVSVVRGSGGARDTVTFGVTSKLNPNFVSFTGQSPVSGVSEVVSETETDVDTATMPEGESNPEATPAQ